jgi:hypothetical protein
MARNCQVGRSRRPRAMGGAFPGTPVDAPVVRRRSPAGPCPPRCGSRAGPTRTASSRTGGACSRAATASCPAVEELFHAPLDETAPWSPVVERLVTPRSLLDVGAGEGVVVEHFLAQGVEAVGGEESVRRRGGRCRDSSSRRSRAGSSPGWPQAVQYVMDTVMSRSYPNGRAALFPASAVDFSSCLADPGRNVLRGELQCFSTGVRDH